MISRKTWQTRCPSLRIARASDGTAVYRQGEYCGDVYIIMGGHIKLSRVNMEGSAQTLIVLSAGELCGAPLTGEIRPCAPDTAIAKGDVELYRIPVSVLMAALPGDAELTAFVVQRLAKRQVFLARRVEQLLSSDVGSRVASILCELCRGYGGRCVHGHEVDIRLTQQELAEMAGATRPTVSTVLNRLRERRIISYTRHFICIEDMQALKGMSIS